jgi:hypothetical protein
MKSESTRRANAQYTKAKRERLKKDGYDRLDWWCKQSEVHRVVAALDDLGLGRAFNGWERIRKNRLGVAKVAPAASKPELQLEMTGVASGARTSLPSADPSKRRPRQKYTNQ